VKTLIEPENLLVQLARLNKLSHQFQDLRKTYKKPPLQDLRKTYKKPPPQDLRKTYKKTSFSESSENSNFFFRLFGKRSRKTPLFRYFEKLCLQTSI